MYRIVPGPVVVSQDLLKGCSTLFIAMIQNSTEGFSAPQEQYGSKRSRDPKLIKGEKTILIVDDHPLFREGLKFLISKSPHLSIVGEAGSGKEALDQVNEHNPDLVIMDICLPDKSGILVTRDILRLHPGVGILIVSMHSKIEHITEAFRSGALGYVLKESISERLLQGLECVARGEYFFDSMVSERIIHKLMEKPRDESHISDDLYRRLTPRERQVMKLLAEGKNTKELSERLYISPKTAENHRASLMRKLGLHSTAELIRYSVKLGIIDTGDWTEE
jgi:DNA-binding NarL/FixJ family response regulator